MQVQFFDIFDIVDGFPNGSLEEPVTILRR